MSDGPTRPDGLRAAHQDDGGAARHPDGPAVTTGGRRGGSRPPEDRRSPPAAMRDTLKEAATGSRSIHPALVPGISVEDTGAPYPTRRSVFVIAMIAVLGVLAWAILAPESLKATGTTMQEWVVIHFGWLLGSVMVAAILFMLVIGLAPTGGIRLGADDSEPEFSTPTWISMLFAAGLGIGLIFYGPLEPLTHFFEPPPTTTAEAQTGAAVMPALTSAILHQASLAWGVYALIGGAIAYSAYRRGRLPLISSLFEPVFPDGSNRVLGKVIDVFAVLVTLFGTATSLGIGALQIRTGTSIITGRSLEGNGFVVVAISLLTVVFVLSAVSGVKRGIRLLSNINMLLVVVLAVFVALVGPTLFLLDLFPAALISFFVDLPGMLSVRASEGPVEAEYLTEWTMLYWAWWISWSPFVGMFIAKISKGRTIRQFVLVVVMAPSLISIAWFTVFGGTVMWLNLQGKPVTVEDSGENVMFDLLGQLPLAGVSSVVVLVAILIFFTTAADSATNVMGSMSQSGRPVPAKPVTIIWGVALGAIALFLLLAGGTEALSGLQSIMVTCALPFAIITIGIMISWAKDLASDPLIIRRRYALEAIRKGVHRGIDEHGDDFVFGTSEVPEDQGAGAGFASDDPSLTEWYTDAAADAAQADEAATGGTPPATQVSAEVGQGVAEAATPVDAEGDRDGEGDRARS